MAGAATGSSAATTATAADRAGEGSTTLDSKSRKFLLYLHSFTVWTGNPGIGTHNQLLKVFITLETMIFKDRHGIRLLLKLFRYLFPISQEPLYPDIG